MAENTSNSNDSKTNSRLISSCEKYLAQPSFWAVGTMAASNLINTILYATDVLSQEDRVTGFYYSLIPSAITYSSICAYNYFKTSQQKSNIQDNVIATDFVEIDLEEELSADRTDALSTTNSNPEEPIYANVQEKEEPIYEELQIL